MARGAQTGARRSRRTSRVLSDIKAFAGKAAACPKISLLLMLRSAGGERCRSNTLFPLDVDWHSRRLERDQEGSRVCGGRRAPSRRQVMKDNEGASYDLLVRGRRRRRSGVRGSNSRAGQGETSPFRIVKGLQTGGDKAEALQVMHGCRCRRTRQGARGDFPTRPRPRSRCACSPKDQPVAFRTSPSRTRRLCEYFEESRNGGRRRARADAEQKWKPSSQSDKG